MSEEDIKTEAPETEPKTEPTPPDEGGVSDSETKPRPKDLPEDQEWKHVELSPDAQRRFNRLYAQVKTTDRVVETLATDNRALLDRLTRLEQGQGDQAVQGKITGLARDRREALEAGDLDKASRIDDQIVDLKVASAQAKAQAKIQPKEPEKLDQGVSPQDQVRIKEWAEERDDSGNYARPWADPGHPDHGKAMRTASVVIGDPGFTLMDDVLEEVDRIMGKPKAVSKPVAAAVLSSTPPREKPKDKIVLSAEEKIVAGKMGMKLEQYAKAKKTWTTA